jgi:hypothetical protein
MTALERRLISMGFGALLVFALPLVGDDLAAWLLWPCLIGGAVLLHRVPVEGSRTSAPVTSTSAHSHSDLTCGDGSDWADVADCI